MKQFVCPACGEKSLELVRHRGERMCSKCRAKKDNPKGVAPAVIVTWKYPSWPWPKQIKGPKDPRD